LLQEPERVADEYKRRLAHAGAGAEEPEEVARLEKQMAAVRRGIGRLIDSYAEGFVEKGEFVPRITGMKQRMSQLTERFEAAVKIADRDRDIQLVVSRLEDFAVKVSEGLARISQTAVWFWREGVTLAAWFGEDERRRGAVRAIWVEVVFGSPGGPSVRFAAVFGAAATRQAGEARARRKAASRHSLA
jgi:hypothetical protein